MEQQSVENLVDPKKHWREQQHLLRIPLTFLRCPSGKEKEMTYINSRDTGVVEETNFKCHYVGNLGARPDTCDASSGAAGSRGGGTSAEWTTFPELTYESYSCHDDPPAIPSNQDPPPATDPGGAPGAGGTGTNGVIFPRSNLEIGKITDGTSNTIIFGEMSWDIGPQEPWIVGSTSRNGTDPVSSAYGVVYNSKNIRWPPNSRRFLDERGKVEALSANAALGSYHPGGVNIVMADGSGKFLRDEVDVKGALRPMASRASEDIYEMP
jgi:prepilin-type processing-associated H-X9-DG protein